MEPVTQKLVPVKEATMYPSQFPILLRERMQGQSVAEVAEYLGISPKDVNRLLAGHWRPAKGICRKIGLEAVYALAEQPRREIPVGLQVPLRRCARARRPTPKPTVYQTVYHGLPEL